LKTLEDLPWANFRLTYQNFQGHQKIFKTAVALFDDFSSLQSEFLLVIFI